MHPTNQILYQDYNAKLSDFGLAKDGPEGDKTHVSTRVMGTYGYAAPEYVMTGKRDFLLIPCHFLIPIWVLLNPNCLRDRHIPVGSGKNLKLFCMN